MADSLKATPLVERHRALGARLVPFAGYEMPVQYAGIVAEHVAVRERAGLFDVSHMGELKLTGPGALAQANRLVTNDLERVADGQAMYTCCCNERGTILDDLILYRHSPEDILVVCNASNRDKIVAHFQAELKGIHFEDQSDATALLALQGPRALEILSKELSFDASTLKFFRFQAGQLAGVDSLVARTGYTGEDGVEIFCAAKDAVHVWDALLKAGEEFGIAACGLGARDTLRLEARLSLYGNDIDETTNPLEAGLGWTVKLDKPDFIGKAALEEIRAAGLTRKLVGFECIGRGIARHGYPVLPSGGGEPIGVVTSGGPSPTLSKNIGMAYVPSALSEIGSEFSVDCRGREVAARIVKTPFYKRPQPS